MLRFVVQLQVLGVQPCHSELLELGIIAIARQQQVADGWI